MPCECTCGDSGILSIRSGYVKAGAINDLDSMGIPVDPKTQRLDILVSGDNAIYIGFDGVVAADPTEGVAGSGVLDPGDSLTIPGPAIDARRVKIAASSDSMVTVVQRGDR